MFRKLKYYGGSVKFWFGRRWSSIVSFLGFSSYPELKQIIYMDEESLISLLASTTGGITQQKVAKKSRMISSSISSIKAKRNESEETVRKYVIQSNFKEFYEMRKNEVLVSDKSADSKRTKVIVDEEDDFREEYSDVAIRSIGEISRGRLFELDCRLDTETLYELYLIFDSFEKVIESLGSEKIENELQEMQISDQNFKLILDAMEFIMDGLVPIKCEICNYGTSPSENIVLADKKWASENEIKTEKAQLVGFINDKNLWEKPSEVLFDEKKFTVYGRFEDSSVAEDWSPLKVKDVLESVLPELAEDIEELPQKIEEEISDNHSTKLDSKQLVDLYIQHIGLEGAEEYREELINQVEDMEEIDLDVIEENVEIMNNHLAENGIDVADRKKDLSQEVWHGAQKQVGPETGKGKDSIESDFIAMYW